MSVLSKFPRDPLLSDLDDIDYGKNRITSETISEWPLLWLHSILSVDIGEVIDAIDSEEEECDPNHLTDDPGLQNTTRQV